MSHARPTRRPAAGLGNTVKGGGLLLLVVAAFGFPLVFSNPATTNYGVQALIFVVAATAWNIFSGNSGYISLGQAVFYGSGAYTLVVAAKDWNLQGNAAFAL